MNSVERISQMQLSDELTLSYYRQIAYIDQDHSVSLVQHTETGEFYVKKQLKIYNLDVYQSLRSSPVPNTPAIFELIEDQDELIVIEEYFQGNTLQQILDKNGVFTEDSVIDLMLMLCQIISDLHHRQPPIINRDIKPSNLLISSDGVLKLLDFNTAKFATEDQSRDTRLLGTAGYAAPEQYGFGASVMQTDLYSIGVLMNVLLTGRLPSEQLADSKLTGVIRKCTQLNPSDRFSNIDDLAEEIKSVKNSVRNSKKEEKNIPAWRRYLPPGFRTGSLFHEVIAVFGYIIIFYFGFTLEISNPSRLDLLLNRCAFILIFLAIVFFTFNYLGVQKNLPLTDSKHPFIRFIGIILYDVLIASIIIIILLILESLII